MNIKTLILALGLLAPMTISTSCTPYMGLVNRQEDGLAMLTRALTGVNDSASAAAAIPAVNQYGSLLMSDVTSLFQNGRPSLLELLILKNSYQNSNIKQQSKDCLSQLYRIHSNQYYGNQDLRSAFLNMLVSGASAAR